MSPLASQYEAAAPTPRRLLVVDDQQQIHDAFQRIFLPLEHDDNLLDAFETRFLEADLKRAGSVTDRQPAADSHGDPPSYQLAHVLSGEHAAELVAQSVLDNNRFRVAFVDMRMPCGWDGLETTEQLWRLDPMLQIVICTAHSDHLWEDVLRRLGYSDRLLLLKKPFESDEIRQLALALSEKSRLAAEQHRRMAMLRFEVEQRQRLERDLREMALRDTLTQLPNRTFLLHRLKKVIDRRAKESGLHDALLFLDLDNFKIINDSLGHEAGDNLLRQVAARLKECVRRHDIATRCPKGEAKTVRLGGDEFVVMLERMSDYRDALVVAARIVSRLTEPFTLGDRVVSVSASVGVAFVDQYVHDGNEALRNADTAMYRAKQAGKGRIAIFDRTMHEAVCARLSLEERLRQAVDKESFSLCYQPIVELASGMIRGVEALIHWRDEDGQFVSPSEFVPVVEEIGLIVQVGEWVIERATREIGALRRSLPLSVNNEFYVGVNTSRLQLTNQMFLEHLVSILNSTGFERRLLKLEMSESSDTREAEQVSESINKLHHAGIGIHIDDFGKGRSSLTCFHAHPVESVKIDRSFTASIVSDHSHAAIAQAVIKLAHDLQAKVIAEGVESESQMTTLHRWNCDLAQGYLFAPPLDVAGLRELVCDPDRSAGIRLLRQLAAKPIVAIPLLPDQSIPAHDKTHR